MNRRDFLKISGFGAAGTLLGGGLISLEGCFTANDSKEVAAQKTDPLVTNYLKQSRYPNNVFIQRLAEETVTSISIPVSYADNILDEAKKLKIKEASVNDLFAAYDNFLMIDDFKKKYVHSMVLEEPYQYLSSKMLQTGIGDCDTLGFLELGIAQLHGLPYKGMLSPTHFFIRHERDKAVDELEGRIYFNPVTGGEQGLLLKGNEYTLDEKDYHVQQISSQTIHTETFHSIGDYLYFEKNKPTEAIKAYDKALHIFPTNVAVHNNKGSALHNMKEYDLAIKSLEQAIQLYPFLDQPYYNLANIYKNLNKHEKAIEMINDAIAINPDSYNYNLRAEIYEKTGNLELASQDKDLANQLR
jgi:tetratricopeptide (TPR) repeat protein